MGKTVNVFCIKCINLKLVLTFKIEVADIFHVEKLVLICAYQFL